MSCCAAALMRRGVFKAAAASLQSAGRADVKLMYNHCGNYMLNTVPPVFVLIIQQILMAGCGMIEALRRKGGVPEGGLMHMAGRALMSACLGMAFSLLYFWALAYADDLIRPRDFGAVLLHLMPFFMASAMCGHLIGRFTNSQSLVMTAMQPISVPCLFLTGCILSRKTRIQRGSAALLGVEKPPWRGAQLTGKGSTCLNCKTKFKLSWDIKQGSDDLGKQVAVRSGFEPEIRFRVYTLSRRAPSATRTSHRSSKERCIL